MLSIKTPGGRKLTVEQLSKAESAIRVIAANNKQLLAHHYDTSSEDVEAIVELAHQKWFELGGRGRK